MESSPVPKYNKQIRVAISSPAGITCQYCSPASVPACLPAYPISCVAILTISWDWFDQINLPIEAPQSKVAISTGEKPDDDDDYGDPI